MTDTADGNPVTAATTIQHEFLSWLVPRIERSATQHRPPFVPAGFAVLTWSAAVTASAREHGYKDADWSAGIGPLAPLLQAAGVLRQATSTEQDLHHAWTADAPPDHGGDERSSLDALLYADVDRARRGINLTEPHPGAALPILPANAAQSEASGYIRFLATPPHPRTPLGDLDGDPILDWYGVLEGGAADARTSPTGWWADAAPLLDALLTAGAIEPAPEALLHQLSTRQQWTPDRIRRPFAYDPRALTPLVVKPERALAATNAPRTHDTPLPLETEAARSTARALVSIASKPWSIDEYPEPLRYSGGGRYIEWYRLVHELATTHGAEPSTWYTETQPLLTALYRAGEVYFARPALTPSYEGWAKRPTNAPVRRDEVPDPAPMLLMEVAIRSAYRLQAAVADMEPRADVPGSAWPRR